MSRFNPVEAENRIRNAFETQAVVLDRSKGYISASWVNQRVKGPLQRDAAMLIDHHFGDSMFNPTVVTGIPNSGLLLAGAVATVMGLDAAPSRKINGESDLPGAWRSPIITPGKAQSFTTNDHSGFAFNQLKKDDRVILVEDVIASGETALVVCDAFQKQKIPFVLVAYFAKEFDRGLSRLREIGVEPVYLVGISNLENGDVNLSPPKFRDPMERHMSVAMSYGMSRVPM